MMLHDSKNEELKIDKFFQEVHELYVKVSQHHLQIGIMRSGVAGIAVPLL